MARPLTGRPTDGELEILNVLWERGPSTSSEVRDAIALTRPVSAGTVQKALQIMARKRLVAIDRSHRTHVFRPQEPRGAVVARMVTDLLKRALEGSRYRLMMHALESKPLSREEREGIRHLLEEAAPLESEQ